MRYKIWQWVRGSGRIETAAVLCRNRERRVEKLDRPFSNGETRHDRREELYQRLHDGDLEALTYPTYGGWYRTWPMPG